MFVLLIAHARKKSWTLGSQIITHVPSGMLLVPVFPKTPTSCKSVESHRSESLQRFAERFLDLIALSPFIPCRTLASVGIDLSEVRIVQSPF